MSGNPADPSVADTLLVDELPEPTREALRRLSAAGVLAEVLDAYPDDDDGCYCGCHATTAPGFDVGTLLAAFRLGWTTTAGIGTAPPPDAVAWRLLAEANVV